MVNIIEEKYRVIFLHTASSYIKKLQQTVVNLINDSSDPTIIEDAYLATHSLKSECLMMQYKNLANFFLLLETLFRGKRDNKFQFTKEMLFLTTDELEKLLEALPSLVNENITYDISQTYQKLQVLSGVTVQEL